MATFDITGGETHTRDQSSPVQSSKKRNRLEKINYPKKRVAVACEICRSRKTRCDAKKPACGFCADIGAKCVYRRYDDGEEPIEIPSPAISHADPTSASEQHEILARLDRIEGLLRVRDAPQTLSFAQNPSPEASEQDPFTPHAGTQNPAGGRGHKLAFYGRQSFTIGFSLGGFSKLSNRPCPVALEPLCQDDFEEQLEEHMAAGDSIFRNEAVPLDSLDLALRRCWQLTQTFTRDILPWLPILDSMACTNLVTRAVESGFHPRNPETSLCLLILALGSFAEAANHFVDDPDNFPGIDYFRAACQLAEPDKGSANALIWVQCHIFMACYLLYTLRPLQAYETVHQAAHKIVILLQRHSHNARDPLYGEMCNRAYWACYLLEHELQGYVPFGAILVQGLQDEVPLPTSDYEEPGIYWFLSEITNRRIFTRLRQGLGWNMHSLFEPVVAREISAQLMQWQATLPQPVAFAFEDSMPFKPLLDPQKVFLRAQFFATKATILWQYIVQLLTSAADGVPYSRTLSIRDSAGQCLKFAVFHVYAAESLFQGRHVMLMANVTGLYTMGMMLLCAYDVHELRDVLPIGIREAIVVAWRCLSVFKANRIVERKARSLERLMRGKGIGIPVV
ncbi:hypothetical protein IQ07DRAFT_604872 [Pyrenochaeta sp. DS3sAY3a]|nr:hypothetical protein IQ07DRAFT_604872 [Pyrenochaeta sp. DS3sAY3a]